MKHNSQQELSDEELTKLYQAQATEQPSETLDEQILALAKDSISSHTHEVIRPKADFWRQYRWPISSVASVMLVVTLVLVNPKRGDEVIMDGSQPLPQMSSRMITPDVAEVAPQAHGEDKVSSTFKSQQKSLPVESTSPSELQRSAKDVAAGDMDVTERVETQVNVPKTQAKAVISDRQAINHLTRLVETEQWHEATILLARINKERPQLANVAHPQHQQWRALAESIKSHLEP
jgi:hypothetical protein